MAEYYNQEREISLVDIFALCLRKLAVLSLCAVVGAVLVTGFHIYHTKKSFNSAAVEKKYLEKKAELETQKEVKNLEYELTLGPFLGTVPTADYKKAIDLFTSLDKSIASLEKEISGLEAQLNRSKPFYSVAKYAVIGFLAGGFISFMWIVIVFVVSEPVTRSEDSRERLKAPLLGALFPEGSCFERLARKTLGEVHWKDRATALRWFEENLDSTVLPDKACVAVLYSGNNARVLEAAKEVLAVLGRKGYEASFIADAALNPETNSKVQSCDAVLFFEKQWVSKWKDVCACEQIAKRFNKIVAGFVLC